MTMFTGADRHLLLMINAKLNILLTQEEKQMANMQALQEAVANQTTVAQSIVMMLDGLAQQLRDTGGDPAAMEQVIGAIEANTRALADAIIRNTVAESERPGPAPEPA